MNNFPIFTLNLNKKILPGRVTIGEYDGKHPCLTGKSEIRLGIHIFDFTSRTSLFPAATVGEKVFIHNPHQKMGHAGVMTSSAGRMEASQANHEIVMLNINQVNMMHFPQFFPAYN